MTISIQNFSGLKITFSETKNYRNTLICNKIGNEKFLAGLNNEEAIAAQVENNLHHIFSSRHAVFALLHPS